MSDLGKIQLTAEDGTEETFFVLEEAEIAGNSYLLVANDIEEEEADALILKQQGEGDMLTYEVVEDEKELLIISKYMEELLEDVDIEL